MSSTLVARRRRRIAARDGESTSGFFDATWYRRKYPDHAAGTDAELWVDYLEHGFRDGRNPGPLFDGGRYLVENPDVAAAQVNPLVHFLSTFGREDRRAWTPAVTEPGGRPHLQIELRHVPQQSARVAVMVHAHYPDTFDEIGRALRSIPLPFGLFVSVPSDEARQTVLRSSRNNRLPADADVRVCPNRGRNFGPLVATFGQELLSFDYLLHLHTKRSLYTGNERTEWRSQLVKALSGSEAVVLAILNAFRQQPELGLLFPATTPSLSYWAHHWLRNRWMMPDVFTRLGVSEFPTDGYFPYPVGGMFWARVEAIRPLLAGTFTVEDFPPESGQTDGTLAHVLERTLVPLVHSRGSTFVQFEPTIGAFRLEWADLHLDQYLRNSPDELAAAIDAADLVSFDIFDTLVTRRSARPDSVLRFVGLRVEAEHPGAHGFFERRKDAERRAREARNGEGDVDIDEIYAGFVRDDGWDDETVRLARHLEVEIERSCLVPRNVVVEAARGARSSEKRVIAISDTYLTSKELTEILDRQGMEGVLDETYLSSERRARKDRGDLWDLVAEREAGGRKWLHVGDNDQSDLQAATDRGIATYHCMTPLQLLELRGLERVVSPPGRQWGNDLVLGPSVVRMGGDPFPDTGRFRPIDLPLPFDVGYAVFAPIVVGFLHWLAAHPAFQSVDHVYFFSREGYLLQQAWERWRSAGAPLPESTYLMTSRRAAMASAQALRFDPDAIVAGSDFRGRGVDLLSSRLGFVLEEGDPLAHQVVRLPEDRTRVIAAINGWRDRIVAHGEAELRGMAAYLRHVGMMDARCPAVVDVGYSGTIQAHLQTLLRRGLRGFYMGTLADARRVEDADGSEFGCFVENHPDWQTPSDFLRHSLLLEAFLTAPSGQTERTEVVDGEIKTVVRSEYRTSDELAVLDELHRGALRYIDDLLKTYGPLLLEAPVDPGPLFQLVVSLATGGIRSPRVRSALVVDDDYCGVPRRNAIGA